MSNREQRVFELAARTASANSASQVNHDCRGVALLLNITAVSGTTPTLDLKVQVGGREGGVWVDIPGAAFAQKTAAGTDSLVIYPGVTVAANRSIASVIPRLYRVVATLGGTTPSFEFSLTAQLVV